MRHITVGSNYIRNDRSIEVFDIRKLPLLILHIIRIERFANLTKEGNIWHMHVEKPLLWIVYVHNSFIHVYTSQMITLLVQLIVKQAT